MLLDMGDATRLLEDLGHLTFDEPIALAMLSEWLDNRLAAAGLEAPA